jgi:transmembrane sensor
MDDLLVKHLLGEATEAEQAEVQAWLQEDVEHQRQFEQFRAIWEAGATLAARSNVDENAAWERFVQRTQQAEQQSVRPKTIPLTRRTWLRAAAAIALFAIGGWSAWIFTTPPAQLYVESGDQTLIHTLPDGSVVTLNKHASLSYPRRFAGNIRSVALEGEGFFEVTPDKRKPFVIQVADVSVKVVGTSFNIKNSEGTTEVIVETGAVEVSKKEQGVLVHPNEKAIVRPGQHTPVKQENTDALYNYYRTREFVCKGTPLWRLTNVLNEAYDVDIIVADRLKGLPLTATFRDEPLENILTVIGETFNIEVERNGRQIILK